MSNAAGWVINIPGTKWSVQWNEQGGLTSVPFTIAESIKKKASTLTVVKATPVGPSEPPDLSKSYQAYRLTINYLYALGHKKLKPEKGSTGYEWPSTSQPPATAELSLYEQITAKREARIEPEKLAFWKSRLHEFYNSAHDEKGRFTGDGVGGRVGTSKPTTVKEKAAYVAGEGPRQASSLISEENVPKTIARQAAVPGFEDFAGKSDRAALNEISDRQASNIVDAVDRAYATSPAGAELHAGWYPFAHEWIGNLAEKNGFPPDAVTAAAAVLSPSADWADNIAWTKNITEMIKADPTITRDQADAYYLTRLAKWSDSRKNAQENGKVYTDSSGKEVPAPDYPGQIIGHKLSELSDQDAAIAIRGAHDQGRQVFGRQPGVALEKGEGAVYQLGGHAGFGNPKNRTIPQSDDNLTKAVSVLRDPSTANIDKQLGDANKVRSFYNNMRDPTDRTNEEVTVDTHHYGVANNEPWTAASPYVKSGTASITQAPKTGATGAIGTYSVVVDATRKATDIVNKKYGTNYTPDQVQSIVWENHRARFPDTIRSNKPMIAAINEANTSYAHSNKDASARRERDSKIETARLAAGGPTAAEIGKWYEADLKGETRPTLAAIRKAAKGGKRK